MTPRHRNTIITLMGSAAVALAFWEIAAMLSPKLVPHAWQIASSACRLLAESSFRSDVVATVARTGLSFLLAALIGWPVGLFIGAVPLANRAFIGPMDFLRSIPAFVLLPLFLVFLKSGESARIGMAAFGSGLVIIANTAFGVSHVGRLRVEVARVYGASQLHRLGVVFMQALPQALDGGRLALSLALVLTVVGEIMLGATHGLGTRVNDSLAGFNLPQMYAIVFLIGLLGYAVNVLARVVSERLGRYGRFL